MTPVMLLTGFLGSGKTTLLSRLLQSDGFRNTAVIVNEFGEVSLDHDMIASADETVIALGNGCLCCQTSSDISATLFELSSRRANGEISFDRVIIETSGLVDPVPLLHALGTDHLVAMNFVFAGVITVVDAVAGTTTLQRYDEARRQVAMADMLLLSKLDMEEAQEDQIVDVLKALNSTAVISDVSKWKGALPQAVESADLRSPLPRMSESCHSHQFSSVTLVRERALPAVAIPLFLEGLAVHLGERLLRLKGIVALAEEPDRPMVMHVVQHMVHKPHWLARWPSCDRRSRIVLIGHDIPPEWPSLLLDAIEAEVWQAHTASDGRKRCSDAG